MNINLQPKKILLFFSVGTLLMLSLHLFGYFLFLFTSRPHPIEWFNFDAETNLPTVYSTVLLMVNGVLLSIIACSEKKRGGKTLPWWIMSLLFFALGLDESAMIHERVSEFFQTRFNTTGILFYAWVVPYGIGFLLFVGIMSKFFFGLPKDTRTLLFIAGSIFVVGAIGLEMAASALIEDHGRSSLYYVYATIEEFMELVGTTTFIYVFARHIDRHLPKVSISFNSDEA